jgi:hypothetical protein
VELILVGFSCGGIVGASGSLASLTLGNIVVNTLTAGSNASLAIVNSGASLNNVWNMTFGLPCGATGATGQTGQTGETGATGAKGDTGQTGSSCSLTRGNIVVNTLAAGSDASLSIINSGTSLNNVWNMTFGLPIGATGATGQTGATGANGQDCNYATVATMIAANDLVITSAYILYISSAITAATTALETQIGALSTAITALTERVTALETSTNQ